MAITGITTRTREGHIEGIWLDAVISELHSMQSDVTEHPVEEGVDVSDHIRPKPNEIRLECKVTNTPARLPFSHADGSIESVETIDVPDRELFGFRIGAGSFSIPVSIGTPQSAVMTSYSPGFDRVASVFDELRAIHEDRRVVTIRTTLRDYLNMAITDIAIQRQDAKTKVLEFTITARQIASAESRTVEAPRPVQQRAKSNVSAGRQAAAEAAPESPQAEQAQSVLSQLSGII
jgi:hypothetical protein